MQLCVAKCEVPKGIPGQADLFCMQTLIPEPCARAKTWHQIRNSPVNFGVQAAIFPIFFFFNNNWRKLSRPLAGLIRWNIQGEKQKKKKREISKCLLLEKNKSCWLPENSNNNLKSDQSYVRKSTNESTGHGGLTLLAGRLLCMNEKVTREQERKGDKLSVFGTWLICNSLCVCVCVFYTFFFSFSFFFFFKRSNYLNSATCKFVCIKTAAVLRQEYSLFIIFHTFLKQIYKIIKATLIERSVLRERCSVLAEFFSSVHIWIFYHF